MLYVCVCGGEVIAYLLIVIEQETEPLPVKACYTINYCGFQEWKIVTVNNV